MAKGYMGRVLNVDLSSGGIREEELDERVLRDFVGGYGLGAKVLYDRLPPQVDPLGPENILGFLTGPLTGTPAITGNRFVVVCKSPLTQTWGDANCGGTFGPNLKFAGYDGVFFTGQADSPVYLYIDNGKAELRDASWLWGRDCVEVDDLVREKLGPDVDSACIGPSGEALSLISCVINDRGRAAGRSGVGAVMGSKKLKAIAVRGQMEVPIADLERAEMLRREYVKRGMGAYDTFHKFGTLGFTADSAMSGDSPVKNWGGAAPVDFPQGRESFRDTRTIEYQTKRYGCWRCTISCGGHMEVKEGPYAGTKTHKVEYETACAFGTLILNDDFPSLIKANDIVNRAGLDSISVGCVVAFAVECFEQGIIDEADTGGLTLRWGDSKAIVDLTEQVAKREGFGDVLADGVKVAAERIGRGAAEYAIHVQGQEVPMHDPRFLPGLATTYVTDATPGRHTQGGELVPPPDVPIAAKDKYKYSGQAEGHKKLVELVHVVNSAGMCLFGYTSYPLQMLPDFLNAVTGWDLSLEDIYRTGERIANIRHAFNLREGLNPLEFNIPGRMIGRPPLTAGNVRDVTVDVDTMFREYFELMDWDPKTSRPSRRKLEELGLGYLADDVAAD